MTGTGEGREKKARKEGRRSVKDPEIVQTRWFCSFCFCKFSLLLGWVWCGFASGRSLRVVRRFWAFVVRWVWTPVKTTGREALQVIVARKGAVLRGCLELPRSVDVSGEVCPASHHTSRSAISAVVLVTYAPHITIYTETDDTPCAARTELWMNELTLRRYTHTRTHTHTPHTHTHTRTALEGTLHRCAFDAHTPVREGRKRVSFCPSVIICV